MEQRGSGILLHVTSLDSEYGIGDLGPSAYRFADFLNSARQSYWQILPLNPTDTTYGNSPYTSISAFAGNVFLISPELMVKDGWLDPGDLDPKPTFPVEKVDYEGAIAYKIRLFDRAYQRFKKVSSNERREYEDFCARCAFWLEDFALFFVIKKNRGGQMWSQWPADLRDRNVESLKRVRDQLVDEIEQVMFEQYLFFKQWMQLRAYCREKNIQIIGDIPIYVSCDGVDVWTHPHLFKLDKDKNPVFVAGVPPDYFSKTGQRWGNPVYNWDILKRDGYQWWLKRVRLNLSLFDWVRIDHFRGLVAYWEIPAEDPTAENGYWVEVPCDNFFNAVQKAFPSLPIIAEDLGTITPDVTEAMERFGFPGMKVFLFAFGGDLKTHPYIPENYVENCVAYTGTHDNNTVEGWFHREASPEEREQVTQYLGQDDSAAKISWKMITALMKSIANTVIIPAQDVLGLGSEARMNVPATVEENWRWRLCPGAFDPVIVKKLSGLVEATRRVPGKRKNTGAFSEYSGEIA